MRWLAVGLALIFGITGAVQAQSSRVDSWCERAACLLERLETALGRLELSQRDKRRLEPDISRLMAEAGRMDEALALAAQAGGRREVMLRQVAMGAARAGDIDGAEAAIEGISDPGRRNVAHAEIALGLARAQDFPGAYSILDGLGPDPRIDGVLAQVVLLEIRAGLLDSAAQNTERLEQGEARDAVSRELDLARIRDRLRDASVDLDGELERASALPDADTRRAATHLIIGAIGAAGRPEDAFALAEQDGSDLAWTELAAAVAATGNDGLAFYFASQVSARERPMSDVVVRAAKFLGLSPGTAAGLLAELPPDQQSIEFLLQLQGAAMIRQQEKGGNAGIPRMIAGEALKRLGEADARAIPLLTFQLEAVLAGL